jgi:hypothetical protein
VLRKTNIFVTFLFIFYLKVPYGIAEDSPIRTWTFGDYVVTVERGQSAAGEEDLLTIRQRGILVHSEITDHISFLTPADENATLPEAVSIKSQNNQDIVIQQYSGGAHCCLSIEVATLGETFEISNSLDLRDAGASLIRLPVDLYGFESADMAYAYRWTSFADSPSPTIYIQYDAERGFFLAVDMMRTERMPRETLNEVARRMRSDVSAWNAGTAPPPDYIKAVLGFVYTGDMEGSRENSAEAWPDWVPDASQFITDLYECALPSSPWWPGIAQLNGISPYPKGEQCKND